MLYKSIVINVELLYTILNCMFPACQSTVLKSRTGTQKGLSGTG